MGELKGVIHADICWTGIPGEPVRLMLTSPYVVAAADEDFLVRGEGCVPCSFAEQKETLDMIAGAKNIGAYVADMAWAAVELQDAEDGHLGRAVYRKASDRIIAWYRVDAHIA